MRTPTLVTALAKSFLAGEATVEEVAARGRLTLGREWRWLRPLAMRYIDAFGGKTRPRLRDVIRFLLADRGFGRARLKYSGELWVEHWLTAPNQMRPVEAAKTWGVPAIESVGALADWLHVSPDEAKWFADLKGLGYKERNSRLGHYHYRVLRKQFGGVRLIEAPKPRLKRLQQQILAEILERIPPHPVVHGFVKGRSIKTFAGPHAGKHIVLRMDLHDFFPSFPAARIQTLFRTLGYPESVADLLGGICTNATPRNVWKEATVGVDPWQLQEAGGLYSRPHLPQGAPSSPALANLCSYRADCRLSGLARSADVEYTRYADDLAFSGGEAFARQVRRFSTHIAAILLEEGFSVNHRKTRMMRQGVRQYLAGLVTNHHVNVVRADFDQLKAILTNCVRLGPDGQNRESRPNFRSHLEGRVNFVEMINPAKGNRLRAVFEQIVWP